ncbi:MAG: hypothetical protein PHH98_00160 [Candidatus Gracilibacteria bacterium]|nr:hypothetical protein [Candidatus Gracilibacteria bacterium]
MDKENRLISDETTSGISIESDSQDSEIDVELFVSRLSPQEREIIRKQIICGMIDSDDLHIINSSKHDISGFLSKCEDLTDLELALILYSIGDLISETRRKNKGIVN